MEERKGLKQSRFQIDKLEERIAPAHIVITPPGGDSFRPGQATPCDAGSAAQTAINDAAGHGAAVDCG